MDTAAKTGWEHFNHQADIGVRGFGPTVDIAFEQAAIAMMAVITDPAGIKPIDETKIECDGPDLELLLASWLNAIIFEVATSKMLFCEFKVHIDGTSLMAVCKGEQTDVARHQPTVEVKAATYTELKVEQENGTWIAQCVVDV